MFGSTFPFRKGQVVENQISPATKKKEALSNTLMEFISNQLYNKVPRYLTATHRHLPD